MADRKVIQLADKNGNIYDVKDTEAREDITELKSAINAIDTALFDSDTLQPIDISTKGTVLDQKSVNTSSSSDTGLYIGNNTGAALCYFPPAEKSGKVNVKSVDTTHSVTVYVTTLEDPVITPYSSGHVYPITGGYTATTTTLGEDITVQAGQTVIVVYNRAYSFVITGNIFITRTKLSENVIDQIDDEAEEIATTIAATKQDTLTFDAAPTKGSSNVVNSGALYNTLEDYIKSVIIGNGKNKFDKDNPGNEDKTLLNTTTGATSTNTSYMTTYYIPVVEGRPYILFNPSGNTTSGRAYCFYNSSKVFLSGESNFVGVFIAPTNAAYLRLSMSTGAPDVVMLLEDKFYTGVTYESYKDIRQMKSEIKVAKESDPLFVKASATKNQYNKAGIVQYSSLSTDGYRITNSSYYTSNEIYCGGYDVLITAFRIPSGFSPSTTAMTPRRIAFYDENMVPIAVYGTDVTAYVNITYIYDVNGFAYTRVSIPSGAIYTIIDFGSSNTDMDRLVYCANGSNAFPIYPYESYSEAIIARNEFVKESTFVKTPYAGKTLNVIGDSITYGFGTFTTLQKAFPYLTGYKLNMTTNNYGINSSELAERSAGDTTHDPMCIRYTDMVDADIVVVAGGTNDWEHSAVTLGEMGDTATTTFYGALDTMCKGLIAKYPDKIIIFMTPLKRATYYNPNSLGYTETQFADAIKEVCAFYGIPVLDMYEKCTINPLIEENKDEYLVDVTHPNQKGHIYMASMLAGFIAALLQ